MTTPRLETRPWRCRAPKRSTVERVIRRRQLEEGVDLRARASQLPVPDQQRSQVEIGVFMKRVDLHRSLEQFQRSRAVPRTISEERAEGAQGRRLVSPRSCGLEEPLHFIQLPALERTRR